MGWPDWILLRLGTLGLVALWDVVFYGGGRYSQLIDRLEIEADEKRVGRR